MTIDQAYKFILYVVNKEQRGSFTPDQFNNLAPIMQMSLISDRIGNLRKYKAHDPVPDYAAHINRKSREELRPLVLVATGMSAINTVGDYSLPTGFLYQLTVNDNVTGNVCKEVTRDEFFILNKSVIKNPTASHPVYTMRDSFFTVSPIAVVPRMEYYKKPTNPRWNYTEVSGEAVYNPTGSVDFAVSELAHLEICTKILAAVGVNLDMASVMAYAGMEYQKGA